MRNDGASDQWLDGSEACQTADHPVLDATSMESESIWIENDGDHFSESLQFLKALPLPREVVSEIFGARNAGGESMDVFGSVTNQVGGGMAGCARLGVDTPPVPTHLAMPRPHPSPLPLRPGAPFVVASSSSSSSGVVGGGGERQGGWGVVTNQVGGGMVGCAHPGVNVCGGGGVLVPGGPFGGWVYNGTHCFGPGVPMVPQQGWRP